MSSGSQLLALTAMLLALSMSARAQTTESTLHFLTLTEVKSIIKGVASPKDSTKQRKKSRDRTDVEDIRVLQYTHFRRNPEDCTRAAISLSTEISEAWGKLFSPEQLIVVEDLLIKVFNDMDRPVWMLKKKNKRKRPYERKLSSVSLCPGFELKPNELGKSFPSGPAAFHYIEALVLSEIFRARKAEIMKRAEDLGTDQVLLGAHHPSDVAAGQELANRTFEKMMKNKKFQDELKAVKAKARPSARQTKRS
jgi:hypothetical protein